MGTFGKSRQYHLHTGRRCTPFRLSSERTQAAPLLDRPQTSYLAGAAVFLTFFTSGVAQGRAALRLNSTLAAGACPADGTQAAAESPLRRPGFIASHYPNQARPVSLLLSLRWRPGRRIGTVSGVTTPGREAGRRAPRRL